MRILVTNDDGIHAPGLDVAERIARKLSDDVTVVAPETDQSGIAHALTLSEPLRLRDAGHNRYAVRGTPTDCVIMAVKVVMDAMPDLVLSGVNRGQNIADDVLYSGTVAGAMEGALLGIPSIALSQAYSFADGLEPPWDTAEAIAPELIGRVMKAGLANDRLLNVNFPNCAPSEVKGTVMASQGRRESDWLNVDKRIDGRGHAYYWIGFQRKKHALEPGSDLAALAEKYVAVTPLAFDMTDQNDWARLSALLSEES